MTFFGSLGGFYLKKASSSFQTSIKNLFVFLAIGGIFYVAGAVINIILLKRLPYSIVFPLTSVTYFWTMLLSSVWLKERFTMKKLIGVTLILTGCIFLSLNS
jgi:drug/metabolite transporter (DMT)-like permease